MNNNAAKVHQIPFNLDLNTASLDELQKLPMVGSRERALAVINARPLTSWAQVAHIEGFDISAPAQVPPARTHEPSAS